MNVNIFEILNFILNVFKLTICNCCNIMLHDILAFRLV